MDHLDPPSAELWESRRAWFEVVEDKSRGEGSYLLSEQACALTAEVQACFCTGAWLGVIVLAAVVVDAALRETELPGFNGNSRDLIAQTGADPRLQKLRKRRNALVHVSQDNPAITVDQQWVDRTGLEAEAREAVTLMFGAFYFSPGT
jgi:hypothetical protein